MRTLRTGWEAPDARSERDGLTGLAGREVRTEGADGRAEALTDAERERAEARGDPERTGARRVCAPLREPDEPDFWPERDAICLLYL